MNEKVEKIFEYSGNKHRFQYLSALLTVLMDIQTYFILVILPFLEAKNEVKYIDKNGKTRISTLSYEICNSGIKYETFREKEYSWVHMTGIECNEKKTGILSSSSFAGAFFGSLVIDYVVDRIGRKNTSIIIGLLYSFLIFFVTFCSDFYSITFINFLISFCLAFPGSSLLMLVKECTENNLSSIFCSFLNATFPMSGLIYFPIFQYLRNWRLVFYINASVTFLICIFIYFLLVESPRFYLMKGDFDNTLKCLKNISIINGIEKEYIEKIESNDGKILLKEIKKYANQNILQNDLESGGKKEYGLKTLLKYPSIRYIFLGMCIVALTISGLYNGISIHVKNLSGDLYKNVMIFYSIECIWNMAVGFMTKIKFLGRKGTFLFCYILGIFSFILFFFFYKTNEQIEINNDHFAGNLKNACVLLIKSTVGSLYDNVLYFYWMEIYPTPVRAAGYSINCALDSFGGFFFPLIIESMVEINVFILFFIFTLMQTFIVYYLCPETLDQPLPETFKELEEEGKNNEYLMPLIEDNVDGKEG